MDRLQAKGHVGIKLIILLVVIDSVHNNVMPQSSVSSAMSKKLRIVEGVGLPSVLQPPSPFERGDGSEERELVVTLMMWCWPSSGVKC